MKTALRKILKKINASVIIATIFMFFIVIVGSATIPTVLAQIGAALREPSTARTSAHLIKNAYAEMLTTDLNQSILTNRATYVNLNGYVARLLGQRYVNEVVKMNNGYLTQVCARVSNETSIQRITALFQKQTENGGAYLFVLAPTKNSEYEDLLPPDIKDEANANADDLVSGLRKNGVPVLDLREELHAQGISVDEAFNKTDHHWNAQTGFWAYVQIFRTLQNMGVVSDIPDNLLDANQFEFRIYKNSFLGSLGKRTGQYYAGVDDFCQIIPRIQTSISVKIPDANVDLTGRYEDVAYAEENFGGTDYFNQRSYSAYGYGNRAMVHWGSDVAPIKQRFLVYGDSFGNVPFSLFPLCVQTCDELDMRHFTENFAAYYEEFNPDVIVCLVNVQELSSDSENVLYDFFPGK